MLRLPTGTAEQTLVFIRALDHGILPPGPWNDPPPHDAKIPRESRRKFRKLWRKAAKELARLGSLKNRRVVYSTNSSPTKSMERRRRAMVNDMLVTEAIEVLNNKG